MNSLLIEKLVELALLEDLYAGDITTQLTISKDKLAVAKIIAREDLVFCSAEVVSIIIKKANSELKLTNLVGDGQFVKTGATLLKLSGSLQEILSLERTILNFLQRLSGVATHTRHFVKQTAGLTILDTRKTTPGWRILEKHAVRVGGAHNHRLSLGDMILVKNNHIDGQGLAKALSSIVTKKPKYMAFEVEVRDQSELKQALYFHPDIVMLDNMNDQEIKQALILINKQQKRPLVEISGGINLARLKKLSQIDKGLLVSVGSLTTKAVNVDISLRISSGK